MLVHQKRLSHRGVAGGCERARSIFSIQIKTCGSNRVRAIRANLCLTQFLQRLCARVTIGIVGPHGDDREFRMHGAKEIRIGGGSAAVMPDFNKVLAISPAATMCVSLGLSASPSNRIELSRNDTRITRESSFAGEAPGL